MRISAGLELMRECAPEFLEGHYQRRTPTPYHLSARQHSAVRLLAYNAKELFAENQRLHRRVKELEQQLQELQEVVDAFTSYPEQ